MTPFTKGLAVVAVVLLVFAVGSSPLVILFFLQAEDGIRDYKVTGVQTCALPICLLRPAARAPCRGCRRVRRREADRSEGGGAGKRCRFGGTRFNYKKNTRKA